MLRNRFITFIFSMCILFRAASFSFSSFCLSSLNSFRNSIISEADDFNFRFLFFFGGSLLAASSSSVIDASDEAEAVEAILKLSCHKDFEERRCKTSRSLKTREICRAFHVPRWSARTSWSYSKSRAIPARTSSTD